MIDETLRQLLTLGKEHYLKRDFPSARSYLEQVTERSQSFADVYNMLGVIYHDAGQFSKAQSSFEKALSLNPRYTEAALNLAVLYNDLGKYAEAKATYNKALGEVGHEPGELDPFVAGKIANMHADVADAYRSAGQLSRAVEQYRAALELKSDYGDIRAKLAMALRENGQLQEAAAELRKALEDRPHYIPARVQLGVCLYSMGKIEEAVQEWNEVLNRDPGNASASMYIKLVQTER